MGYIGAAYLVAIDDPITDIDESLQGMYPEFSKLISDNPYLKDAFTKMAPKTKDIKEKVDLDRALVDLRIKEIKEGEARNPVDEAKLNLRRKSLRKVYKRR